MCNFLKSVHFSKSFLSHIGNILKITKFQKNGNADALLISGAQKFSTVYVSSKITSFQPSEGELSEKS